MPHVFAQGVVRLLTAGGLIRVSWTSLGRIKSDRQNREIALQTPLEADPRELSPPSIRNLTHALMTFAHIVIDHGGSSDTPQFDPCRIGQGNCPQIIIPDHQVQVLQGNSQVRQEKQSCRKFQGRFPSIENICLCLPYPANGRVERGVNSRFHPKTQGAFTCCGCIMCRSRNLLAGIELEVFHTTTHCFGEDNEIRILPRFGQLRDALCCCSAKHDCGRGGPRAFWERLRSALVNRRNWLCRSQK
jgi:hypothetical protein